MARIIAGPKRKPEPVLHFVQIGSLTDPYLSGGPAPHRVDAGNGFPLAWDNVIYNSRALGYVTATHQSGIDYGPTVLTWYDALCDQPASVAASGLAGIRIVGGEVRSYWFFQYPDEGRTREMARQAAAQGVPLIIDIEHWSLDNRFSPESLLQMDLEKFEHLIDWAHAEEPGLAVGFYGTVPVSTCTSSLRAGSGT